MAVKNAPMAGKKRTRVFDVRSALESGFKEIAELAATFVSTPWR